MNVLVLIPASEEHKAILQKAGKSCNFTYSDASSVTDSMLEAADIIIGNPPVKRVSLIKNAKLVQLASAGTDGYTDNVLPKNTILTNCTGAYGLAISEHMLGVTFQLMKNLNKYQDNQRSHVWKNLGSVKGIFGSTALIVGLGDIGHEYAKRFKALGGYTIGVRRTSSSPDSAVDEMHAIDELDSLLPRADVVVLCMPGTKATYHIIDEQRLMLMKKDAVIINAGRGTAIDPDALCRVMQSGHLLGAGLDVTEPEPLPYEHKLWDMENVLITPHVSGGYQLDETFRRVVYICAENLKRFLNSEPLLNVIDFSTKYTTPGAKAHFDKLADLDEI